MCLCCHLSILIFSPMMLCWICVLHLAPRLLSYSKLLMENPMFWERVVLLLMMPIIHDLRCLFTRLIDQARPVLQSLTILASFYQNYTHIKLITLSKNSNSIRFFVTCLVQAMELPGKFLSNGLIGIQVMG